MTTNAKLLATTFAAVIIATLIGAWYWFGPKPPKPETYAPEILHADGSRTLERKPDANAKPRHEVPKGATVERIIHLEVKPNALPEATKGADGETKQAGPETPATNDKTPVPCPPVQVDLTLLKNKDESHSVIAYSPNGEIMGGVDVPVTPQAALREPPKWAAGVMYGLVEKRYGAFLDRDIGPFRLGAAAILPGSKEDAVELWVKGGWRF